MGKNVSKTASRQQGNVKSGLSQALGEFVRESLSDTVLVSGLAHVIGVLESERTQVCGPRYRHTEERQAHRGGHVPSSLGTGWAAGQGEAAWGADDLGGRGVAAELGIVVGPPSRSPQVIALEIRPGIAREARQVNMGPGSSESPYPYIEEPL